MAGREMGAWRAAVPGAARVADEAHPGEGLAAFVDENIQPVLERDGRGYLLSRFQARGSLPSRPMANHGRALGKKGVEKIQERVARSPYRPGAVWWTTEFESGSAR